MIAPQPKMKLMTEHTDKPVTMCQRPLVRSASTPLTNFDKLGDENFFHKDYEETLKPVYGDEVDPDEIVVEKGVVD